MFKFLLILPLILGCAKTPDRFDIGIARINCGLILADAQHEELIILTGKNRREIGLQYEKFVEICLKLTLEGYKK